MIKETTTTEIKPLPPRVKDLTGMRFGRLVVIRFVGIDNKRRMSTWSCKCDCGVERVFPSKHLSQGEFGTRSCGCLLRDTAREKIERLRSDGSLYLKRRNLAKLKLPDFLKDDPFVASCHFERGRLMLTIFKTSKFASMGQPASENCSTVRIYAHRYIMAKTLDRCFGDEWEVDHIDQNPLNNNPENLQLTSIPAHRLKTKHDKLYKKLKIKVAALNQQKQFIVNVVLENTDRIIYRDSDCDELCQPLGYI